MRDGLRLRRSFRLFRILLAWRVLTSTAISGPNTQIAWENGTSTDCAFSSQVDYFRLAPSGTVSGFAPRIGGRLTRICSAYDALFESFGLPQKSHYNATKARKCRQTVDKSTCIKSMVSGIPHLPVVPHVRNWQPPPVLVT